MARILIVDDSRTSRRFLKGILEEAGHEIIGEAANGDEGYIKYKELKPDVVTMDITMPVTDGIQALQLIRHLDKEAHVVMVTAAGQKEKMMQAIKAGAEEFITKPFEPEEVVEVIGRILG
ncbi:MAG: response regulator [Lachnospiraceae bacterium]|nr:response regulator [Lachnospiraceae bacterium]